MIDYNNLEYQIYNKYYNYKDLKWKYYWAGLNQTDFYIVFYYLFLKGFILIYSNKLMF